MILKKLALGFAAASLVVAPVAAQAASSRSSAPSASESELGGRSLLPAFIIFALAGIGIAALLLTDDDDDDVPFSP